MTAGGIIPDDDVPALKAAGVAAVFGPGTTIGEVAEYLRANVRTREWRGRRTGRPRGRARGRGAAPATAARSPAC